MRNLAFACVLLLSRLHEADAFELPLTVTETAGVSRTNEPASGGVPLPWGTYKQDQDFAVLQNGKEIPAQILPLVVDENGCLRWILVDTQLNVAAGEKTGLILTTEAEGKKPATPLAVTKTDGGVRVATGVITFSISKEKPFSLFTSVEKKGKRIIDGGSARYTDSTNLDAIASYTAAPPQTIEVFDAGPMRATVKVNGFFTGDEATQMRYIAWITAWAGKGQVQVKYVLANSNPEQFTFRMLRESHIALHVPGASRGTGSGETAQLGIVSVHDLYFHEKQPCQVEAEGDTLFLRGIMAKEKAAGKVPWLSRDLVLVDSTHFSSHYVIDFTGSQSAERIKANKNVLHIMAPPSWYSETNGLPIGRFGTQADEMRCYERWNWSYDKKNAPTKPGNQMPVRRYVHWEDNHYESEEDVLESLLGMYLRTGARSYFITARAWANYYMDLQTFRTDDWRYKDGAVWWNSGGPSWGNRPQRSQDPVTKLKNSVPNPWSKTRQLGAMKITEEDLKELDRMSDSKQCYCHCYGAGLAVWFCLTGERDALEALIDSVEQNYDSQKRARKKVPGEVNSFSRDFTRTSYLVHAARLVVPADPFVCEASDYMNELYVMRPAPEPRGLVKAAGPINMSRFKLSEYVGEKGIERAEALGVVMDPETGELHDTKSGRKWFPVLDPHTWMFTYQSGALALYWRLTGDETAMDHCIAYGRAVAHILWQEKHGNLSYGRFLVDFPRRGFAWDRASWQLPEGSTTGEGVKINGYLARFHPDICARAYAFTGDEFLKKRAYDFWWGGSHRGYNALKSHHIDAVGSWVNIHGDHSEFVNMTGRTFYIWSHPRDDRTPPDPITDLEVTITGNRTRIEFTAPADRGGGTVARYQVKCAGKKIVAYRQYLTFFNEFKEKEYCNWFLAKNLEGEPRPAEPGHKETFIVTGVPEGARFFAVRSFDSSQNRSAMSNLAER